MAYENFADWMADFAGVRFEIKLDKKRIKALRDRGSADLRQGPVTCEGLAKLSPTVIRGDYFKAMGKFVHGRDDDGMQRALELNIATLKAAIAAQLTAPDNIKLAFNLEVAGTCHPRFIDEVRVVLDELTPEQREKVKGMTAEHTERDLEILRNDDDPQKQHNKTGRYLMPFVNSTGELRELGFRNSVDDLVIDPTNPDRLDPRLLSPFIDEVKIDTLDLKPKKDPSGAFYEDKDRDDLAYNDIALLTISRGLKKLAERGGGNNRAGQSEQNGMLPVTFEGVGGAANVAQLEDLCDAMPGLEYAMQGFAFAQPNDDLLALVGKILKIPELKKGYKAPAAPEKTTKPKGRLGRYITFGLAFGAMALGIGAAKFGDAPPVGHAPDPDDRAQTGGKNDTGQKADAAPTRTFADIDQSGGFNDGEFGLNGKTVEFTGRGTVDTADLATQDVPLASLYAASLGARPEGMSAREADELLRQQDAAAIAAALKAGKPIVVARPVGAVPKPPGG